MFAYVPTFRLRLLARGLESHGLCRGSRTNGSVVGGAKDGRELVTVDVDPLDRRETT